MSVGRWGIAVGKWSISMVSIKTAVVQPWVSLWVGLSISGSLSSRLGISRSLTIVMSIWESIVRVGMSVGVWGIAVGKWSISMMAIKTTVVQPWVSLWVGLSISGSLSSWLSISRSLTIIMSIWESIVRVGMSVCVWGIAVGKWSIGMMAIKTAVVQPWVSLRVCLSISGSLSNWLSLSLLNRLNSFSSLLSWSSSGGSNNRGYKTTMGTWDNNTLVICAASLQKRNCMMDIRVTCIWEGSIRVDSGSGVD